MEAHDDDLLGFEAHGAAPLPIATTQDFIDHDGVRIWYATYGSGSPVILLHGGLGNSGNWGYQVPALVNFGQRVVLMDSRGHGRSTRDLRRFTYEMMASDVLAVIDELSLDKAPVVGWSDGACIGLALARQAPARVAGVFFFACNTDPSGTKPFQLTPIIQRCLNRHAKDYAVLSSTPDRFKALSEAIGEMQRMEPNYSPSDLAGIKMPVAIVQGEHDEFIKLEHAEYLARTIPGAELIVLPGVSHFAPLQRPEQFNGAIRTFLERLHLLGE